MRTPPMTSFVIIVFTLRIYSYYAQYVFILSYIWIFTSHFIMNYEYQFPPIIILNWEFIYNNSIHSLIASQATPMSNLFTNNTPI